MWYLLLVFVVAFLGGIIGIIEEIRPLIGPCLVFGIVVTVITLIVANIKHRK